MSLEVRDQQIALRLGLARRLISRGCVVDRRLSVMDDLRFGTVVRAVRQRRKWRQFDLAVKARVSQATISRLERGHPGSLSLETIRRVAAALDIRVDLVARWRAGDLDRLVNARHSALHEVVAAAFKTRFPDWVMAPEASFSIFGERGVIDLLAWHPGCRALLVIELKTDIADVNELLGTFDRKLRLAAQVAEPRGWHPLNVSGWVIVAPGRTNRARIARHGSILRAAFPTDGRGTGRWLRTPMGRISALSIWRNMQSRTSTADLTPIRRVRPRRRGAA
jgi:transcriptional regulator with XRE-family HTH domain